MSIENDQAPQTIEASQGRLLYERIDKPDGSILFRPFVVSEQTRNPADLEGCSSRIKQTLLVVKTMREHGIGYSQAIRNVAREMNVTENAIRDKAERQMQQSAAEVQQLIQEYLDGNPEPLKQRLKQFAGRHTLEQDFQAIDACLSKPSN